MRADHAPDGAPAARRLQVAAAFQGFHHGDFVGVFEVGAHGDADADAGDANAERFEQLGNIDGGGLAFGGGICGHDDFFDGAFFQAFDQSLDVQLLGAATLQWRERTAENVIHAAVGARFFNRENIVGFFDDADRFVIARRADAIETRACVGDVVAGGALADFFFGVADGFGESHGFFGRGAQEMKCEALRGFLSNAGEMFESVDESFNWGGKIGHEGCLA
jgi:hypothetical protein